MARLLPGLAPASPSAVRSPQQHCHGVPWHCREWGTPAMHQLRGVQHQNRDQGPVGTPQALNPTLDLDPTLHLPGQGSLLSVAMASLSLAQPGTEPTAAQG